MIGVQFDGVDGGEGISIQDLISNPLDVLPGATNPNKKTEAAQLWYWDPNEDGNYVVLYLNNKEGDSRYGKWCTTAQAPADTTWGDNRNVVSTKRLTSGMGLWLIRPMYDSAVTVTMAGQVVIAPSGRTYNLHTGFNMISSGFTTAFEINKEGLDWISLGLKGAKNPNAKAEADQLWYWDPNEPGNYVVLYLNGKENDSRCGKWCTIAQVPTDTTWGDDRNVVSPKVIPMGRGFWIVRPDNAESITITVPQPYSL